MIMFANDMAKLDVLVLYVASGSGVFNCDTRRLTGFQSRIPQEMLDPKNKYFEPFQKHYGLLEFKSYDVTVSITRLKVHKMKMFFSTQIFCTKMFH